MRKLRAFIIFSMIAQLVLPFSAFAVTADELKQAYQQATQAAQALEAQKQELNKKLDATLGQKATLNNELKKIDYNISQLNLSIKSSQINSERLGLELQSIQLDIGDITTAIATKRSAVSALLMELYQKDRQGLLALVLKNKSLAASFQEGQNIATLNSGLALELQNLKQLNDQLNSKLKDTADKKQQIMQEATNLQAKKAIVQDQKNDRQTLLAQTKDQESIYQQQISELEKKQLEISDQIDSIETELRKSFNESLLPAKRPGMLAWPLENPYLTQHYGEVARVNGRLLYHGKAHNGTDFGAPIGTPLFAAADGTVSAVGNNGNIEYGKFVLIHMENNLAMLYAHLSNNKVVRPGDAVKKGDVIGYSGNTGYVLKYWDSRGHYHNGAHLHFGLYWDDQKDPLRAVQVKDIGCGCGLVPIGITVNPEDYFPGL